MLDIHILNVTHIDQRTGRGEGHQQSFFIVNMQSLHPLTYRNIKWKLKTEMAQRDEDV